MRNKRCNILTAGWLALLLAGPFVTFAADSIVISSYADANDRWGDLGVGKQTVDCGTPGYNVTAVAVYGYGNSGTATNFYLSFNGSATTTVNVAGYPNKTWATSTFAAVECVGTGTIWTKYQSGMVAYLRGSASNPYAGGSWLSQYHNTGLDDVDFRVVGSAIESAPPAASSSDIFLASTTEAIVALVDTGTFAFGLVLIMIGASFGFHWTRKLIRV